MARLCWLLVLLSAACAADTPAAQLAAQSAIRDAESAGAAERAPAELASARNHLVRAQIETRQRRDDEAQFLAERAEADARLAAAKSRAASAEAELGNVRREGSGAGDRRAR